MKRRYFIGAGTLAVLGGAGYRYWPDQGWINPCYTATLPAELAQHELVERAWRDVHIDACWDCHMHLLGIGDSGPGVWINPKSYDWAAPMRRLQTAFFTNAACANEQQLDLSYIQRLHELVQSFPVGVRFLLLAFDHHYDEQGRRDLQRSPFYTSNDYAAKVAQSLPDRFGWIASIHPYREDCVEALTLAKQAGARAVKWLPPAMGIDPSAVRCDRFYEALVKMNIPLLTHTGDEHAVDSAGAQRLGNPLLLRRPLDQGVRVVVAHCATQGKNEDIDAGKAGRRLENFAFFARLMDERDYEGLLFGEISAIPQINRVNHGLAQLIQREQWHSRLVNGSDYPLPGVMPLFSMRQLMRKRFITKAEAQVLSALRVHNPLLFDFVLKRSLRYQGQAFSSVVFETRRLWESV